MAYDDQRAMFEQSYPDIAAALSSLREKAQSSSRRRRPTMAEFMPTWNAQRQQGYAQAGDELERLASMRADARRERTSPGVTIGAPYQPRPELPPVSDEDFARGMAKLEQLRKNKSPRSKSKLSPEELALNAAAYKSRMLAEKEARYSRNAIAPEARSFKRMAGMGYSDPMAVVPSMSPQDQLGMQLAIQQMEMAKAQQQNEQGLAQQGLNQSAEDSQRQYEMQQMALEYERQAEQNRNSLAREQMGQSMNENDKFILGLLSQYSPQAAAGYFANLGGQGGAGGGRGLTGDVGQAFNRDVTEQDRMNILQQSGGKLEAIETLLRMKGLSEQELRQEFQAITGHDYDRYRGRKSGFFSWLKPNLPDLPAIGGMGMGAPE